jgi:hypothetical protein
MVYIGMDVLCKTFVKQTKQKTTENKTKTTNKQQQKQQLISEFLKPLFVTVCKMLLVDYTGPSNG